MYDIIENKINYGIILNILLMAKMGEIDIRIIPAPIYSNNDYCYSSLLYAEYYSVILN